MFNSNLQKMKQIKCYSVRLKSLRSISEKCYIATAFDGSEALIPKSQVYGFDDDVKNSDAYWISAWILEQKDIQFSTKKKSFFDKKVNESDIEIIRHIPEQKSAINTDVIPDLKK
jgi:hypothetical protein